MSSKIVREMLYESEAPSLIEVASKSSEIVHEMIYKDEAQNLVEVALKSPEIVRENSRISYSRELLLSLSEADNCKELPTGVDESAFRQVELIIVFLRSHFIVAGHLNPVSERAFRTIRNLYVENERVVLKGQWQQGYLALAAVGAATIGSIELSARRKAGNPALAT